MKILIIRNYPSYMSLNNNTYNIQEVGLAKALVRRGHKCDIVFWTNKEEETIEIPVSDKKDNTITIFYKKGRTALKNTVYIGCKELFDKYDILQPCEYNQMEAWYLARKYPQKTVIYHGPYYSQFNKRYNLMCKVFDAFFLQSYKKRNTKFIVKSRLAKEFLEQKGLKNLTVAGVGIDTEMLSNNTGYCKEPLYDAIANNTLDYKLLYIGKFEERRNILFIFDVFKRVRDVLQNTTLYMIGTGNKKYVDCCWRYAKEIDVYDKIVWQERIEQKYLSEIYKLSDCFLLPTQYEIFGMVLLEAMYYKTLVITNNNGGSSTIIKHKQNGVIVNSWESDRWAEAIINSLRDIDGKTLMANRAAATIKNSFTWDSLAPIFEECYMGKNQTGAE